MKRQGWLFGFPLWVAGVGLFVSCAYEAPPSPWEENQKKPRTVPVIVEVIPENDAGTASVIVLKGQNFSPDPNDNLVFFNNVKARILSASDTQLVLYRPNIIGDALTIKVAVAGALVLATHGPYRIPAVVESFGTFVDMDAIVAFAVDGAENLYLAMDNNTIIRMRPDGSRDLGFSATTTTILWTDMKVGPDGYVYMVRSNNFIYRLSTEGGAVEDYIRLPGRNDRVKCIDFHPQGFIYGGGKNSGLFVFRSATDQERLGFYADYDINGIRVFEGYLYVLADYTGTDPLQVQTGLWRHPLQADGRIGAPELVLDWKASPYGTSRLLCMAIAENGVIYLGTNHGEAPIVMYDQSAQVFDPLYYGLIVSPATKMEWGPTTYLYVMVNRNVKFNQGGKFLRINTGIRGAPSWGWGDDGP